LRGWSKPKIIALLSKTHWSKKNLTHATSVTIAGTNFRIGPFSGHGLN